MRLVSQDGTCDIPYNLCSVYMLKAYDCYKVLASHTENYTLATYSTEQKALKAMRMLREGCSEQFLFTIFQFPKDEEIEV